MNSICSTYQTNARDVVPHFPHPQLISPSCSESPTAGYSTKSYEWIRDVNRVVYQRRGIANIPNEIHARCVDINPAEVIGDGEVGRRLQMALHALRKCWLGRFWVFRDDLNSGWWLTSGW
jgi:hypothetical protein